PAGAKLHALRGEQGRSRRDHGRAGEGARPAKDPGERDQPGDDRDRGDTCHWIRRKRLPEDGRDAGSARTYGATGRYRAGGGVPGVVGFQVHDRGDPRGIGWPEITVLKTTESPKGTGSNLTLPRRARAGIKRLPKEGVAGSDQGLVTPRAPQRRLLLVQSDSHITAIFLRGFQCGDDNGRIHGQNERGLAI